MDCYLIIDTEKRFSYQTKKKERKHQLIKFNQKEDEEEKKPLGINPVVKVI